MRGRAKVRHGQTGGGQHVADTSYGDEVRMRRDREVGPE